MTTLTSTNSKLALAVANLFTTPQNIQGYAADDAFAFPDVKTAETMMGVDNILSGGYLPYKTPMDITMQANSPSMTFWDAWIAAQDAAHEVFIGSGTLIYPGLGIIFTLTKGFLVEFTRAPAAKNLLQPRKFVIDWQSCRPSPYTGT